MTGPKLAIFRRGTGLTQAELAGLLGVAGNTIARWERGEMAPPGNLLWLALEALERDGVFRRIKNRRLIK